MPFHFSVRMQSYCGKHHMNRTSILSILAGAGIYLYGSLTPDAVAFARALQSNNPLELRKFADEHRSSPLASNAIRLSKMNSCATDRRRAGGTCDSSNKNSGQSKSGISDERPAPAMRRATREAERMGLIHAPCHFERGWPGRWRHAAASSLHPAGRRFSFKSTAALAVTSAGIV